MKIEVLIENPPVGWPKQNQLERCAEGMSVLDVRGLREPTTRSGARLKCVPFTMRMEDGSMGPVDPDYDPDLIDKLVAEGPGILSWAVNGCKWWLKEGLEVPTGGAMAECRENNDPLKEFFEDCCEADGEYWVRSAELSATYAWRCKKEHERYPLGRGAFGERVKAKGFPYNRSRRENGKQLRTVEGVQIKEEIAKQVREDGGRTLLQ